MPLPGRTARLRRARDRRHATLRALAEQAGWTVVPLLDELAERFPVPPLAGARSARAELSVEGEWQGRPVLVAYVLVRHEGPDAVVLLCRLGAGPRALPPGAQRLADGSTALPDGDGAVLLSPLPAPYAPLDVLARLRVLEGLLTG